MKDTLIGVDLANNVFQLHGAPMTGDVKYCKKLSRGAVLPVHVKAATGLAVMEALRQRPLLGA